MLSNVLRKEMQADSVSMHIDFVSFIIGTSPIKLLPVKRIVEDREKT